ncbi:hypothetical protein LY76DRAFT_88528 [Colletotrichum caudatum]|nr:hypothetical protein LY76DRAFT_88528 [Colletotrichum caudatum]
MPQSMPSSSPPHTTYTLPSVPSDCPYRPYLPHPGDSASTGLALRYHPWRREVPLTFPPSPQLNHFARRCLVAPLCFARTLGQETGSHSGQQRHSSQVLWHRRNRHPVHLDIGQLPAAINKPCLIFYVPQCSQRVSVLSTMLQWSSGPAWTLLCMYVCTSYIVDARCTIQAPLPRRTYLAFPDVGQYRDCRGGCDLEVNLHRLTQSPGLWLWDSVEEKTGESAS